jgi:hypothetical protein
MDFSVFHAHSTAQVLAHEILRAQIQPGGTATHTAAVVFLVPGRYKLTFHGSPHMVAAAGGETAAFDFGDEMDGSGSSAPDKKVQRLPPKFFPCPLLIEVT